jgi:hypothetical protein
MIDDRGRLFGILNVVDALLLVFALGVIPLGYVAYRVFRVPPPRIERIEPASQPLGRELRIRLVGRDLRPYLRVLINRAGEPLSVSVEKLHRSEAQMLIETPTVAEALLPVDMTAGSYDIHLFDGSREIASLPGAFTLVSPSAQLDVVARFPVDEALAGLVRAGDRDVVVGSSGRAASSIGYAQISSVRALEKPATAFAMQSGRIGVQMAARILEAVITVPVSQGESGVWEYRRQAVRAGDPIIFDTPGYTMFGFVVQAHASVGAASK